MKGWHPRSWLALLMGVAVIIFMLESGIIRMMGVTPHEGLIGAAKEIMLALIGGLMVWLGGSRDDDAGKH